MPSDRHTRSKKGGVSFLKKAEEAAETTLNENTQKEIENLKKELEIKHKGLDSNIQRLQAGIKGLQDWRTEQLRHTAKLKKQVKELFAEKDKAEQGLLNSIMASTSKESQEQFEKLEKVMDTPQSEVFPTLK